MSVPKEFKQQLVKAYDADARRRSNQKGRSGWKAEVRETFTHLLKSEGGKTILELGAGAGIDARFFASQGFEVVATDLSPKMVEMCRAAGLNTSVLDIYNVNSLDQKFDAVFSMNALLHIPLKDLDQVLANISSVLSDNGLFFYGTYGGITKEEVTTDPTRMNLPRYFSFLDDTTLMDIARRQFRVVDYKAIDIGSEQSGLHFQSLLLKKAIV